MQKMQLISQGGHKIVKGTKVEKFYWIHSWLNTFNCSIWKLRYSFLHGLCLKFCGNQGWKDPKYKCTVNSFSKKDISKSLDSSCILICIGKYWHTFSATNVVFWMLSTYAFQLNNAKNISPTQHGAKYLQF